MEKTREGRTRRKFAFGLQGEGLGRGLVSINHQNARGLWPRRITYIYMWHMYTIGCTCYVHPSIHPSIHPSMHAHRQIYLSYTHMYSLTHGMRYMAYGIRFMVSDKTRLDMIRYDISFENITGRSLTWQRVVMWCGVKRCGAVWCKKLCHDQIWCDRSGVMDVKLNDAVLIGLMWHGAIWCDMLLSVSLYLTWFVCACMSACVHTLTCVYMYVCTYIWVYVRMHVCM